MKELNTVDLFCGAGGASTGLELALSRLKMCHKGLAINTPVIQLYGRKLADAIEGTADKDNQD